MEPSVASPTARPFATDHTESDRTVLVLALVPAPEGDDRELELPAIDELLDGVTYARLVNGWEVPLLDKVKRRCDEETPSLNSFVQRFAGSHRTIVDLDRAQVSAVVCDA